MTAAEFKKEIDDLSGAYIFFGEEEYLKHFYLCEARKKVVGDESLDLFNRVSIDGIEHMDDIMSAVEMPPMMAEKKLIEVHGIRYASMSDAQIDSLCAMLDAGRQDGTCVIILYAMPSECEVPNVKKPPAFFKALSDHAEPVCFSYQNPSRLVPWLTRHFSEGGVTAAPEVCQYLIERASRDMTALSNEVEKLCAYLAAHSRTALLREDIDFVCCKIDEIAAFDFANAILSADRARAYDILRDMFAKKGKPPVILGSIAAVYIDLYRIGTMREAGMNNLDIAKKLRMNEYRVNLYARAAQSRSSAALRRAVYACAEADRKLKNTQLSPFGILSGLVCTL